MTFTSKEERKQYFIYLIGVYLENDCSKFDLLLQDLDKETLKALILYMIDNINTLPKMNLYIFIKLCLDLI